MLDASMPSSLSYARASIPLRRPVKYHRLQVRVQQRKATGFGFQLSQLRSECCRSKRCRPTLPSVLQSGCNNVISDCRDCTWLVADPADEASVSLATAPEQRDLIRMRQDPYLLSRSAMAIRILPTIILPANLIASSFTTTGTAASESSAANAAASAYRVLVMAAMLKMQGVHAGRGAPGPGVISLSPVAGNMRGFRLGLQWGCLGAWPRLRG